MCMRVSLVYLSQLVSPCLSLRNCLPCTGFVSALTNMSSVGLCSITSSDPSTRSFIQKRLMLMCLDRSEHGPPHFARARHDMLSWYMVTGPVV